MPVITKKSEQEIANEKSNRILEGVAAWASFYRDNPQRFVKDYLNVDLKNFQKILIYEMMHNNHTMLWAARSIGKTWLTALFCVVRCILFPGTKICVASGTRGQANEVLSKIMEDFCKNYDWGSDNLCNELEMSKCSVGANKAEIHFKHGSWIKVVTASDNARGNRANLLILDEFRLINKNTMQTVLKRFMGTPRQPLYLSTPKFKNMPKKELDKYLESNIEIYMSSAWYKNHWSYDKSKAYTVNLLGGREGYFVCAIPYQMAIKEGLKKRRDIEDEMSEADFDRAIFDMEMGCMPYGDNGSSFFSFDDVSPCRTLQHPYYPDNKYNNKNKIPDLIKNERRILSVDIALMASKTHKNDSTSIVINRAIPMNNDYVANIVYLESHEGLLTNELALQIRKLYDIYKCTDLVIDANGVGAGVFDLLIQDIVDPQTGELYPALSVCNNKDMAARCKVANAPQVIWAIKASSAFNTSACTLLRSGFQNKNINLLISNIENEEVLRQDKKYNKMSNDELWTVSMPYVETDALVNELVKLNYEIRGTNIALIEQSGARKDRYSSLAYNYWVQRELSRKHLHSANDDNTMLDYARKLRKLNRKPITY